MLHATEKRDILNRFGYVKRVLERISLWANGYSNF
jgi:hypothetical protein